MPLERLSKVLALLGTQSAGVHKSECKVREIIV